MYDDPSDPTAGFDTVLLALDGDPSAGIALKATPPRDEPAAFRALTVPLAGGECTLFFRLYSLSTDGSRFLLHHTAPHVLRSSKKHLESAAQEAAGGFVGNAAGWAYERDSSGRRSGRAATGPPRPATWRPSPWWPGSSLASTTSRSSARPGPCWSPIFPFPTRLFTAGTACSIPTLAGHDPQLARRLRPYMDRVLAIVDAYVGQVVERAGRDAIVAVASDHGMTSDSRYFKPNVALAQAGLLAVDASGRIDLARTRAVYFPGNSGYIVINRQGRPGGIVPPEEEEEVRRRVTAALTAFKDPASGRPLGVTVTGDLFVEIGTSGIALSTRTTGDAFEARRPEGTHFQKPAERRMLGSFVIAGPGVAAGADLGVIQQIDIAPTLAALLGMDPLAHAVGKPLAAALAKQP